MASPSATLYVRMVACEAAFWLVLAASLVARYVLRRAVLSKWLLRSLPLVDVLLLMFTALDLRAGTMATFAHGLAAAYVGFTVAFASVAVRWADAHFRHRFADGTVPPKAPSRGWSGVRHEFMLWLRCIVACAILVALIDGLIAVVGNPAATLPLEDWYQHAFGCVVIWFLFGPVWNLFLVRGGARSG